MKRVKTAIMAKPENSGEKMYRLSVPVAKSFSLYEKLFYIVKCPNRYYTCIESISGAEIGVTQKTVKETYLVSLKRLENKKDKLNGAIERWIAKHGTASDLPCKAEYIAYSGISEMTV